MIKWYTVETIQQLEDQYYLCREAVTLLVRHVLEQRHVYITPELIEAETQMWMNTAKRSMDIRKSDAE